MKYRPEIDGLRTVAVIPVILFHAGFTLFSGGFVGVDVFFVISGYLITSIIINECAENRFSLLRFYERRARRILPALIVVIACCLPFAWKWMLPDPLENFGQSVFATLFSANNILLWKTSGYWELASEFKPLVHTWSLAVEEQYYIIFPLLILGLWRFRKRVVFAVVSAIFAVSLVTCQIWSQTDPSANFYLLYTRAWELLAGSICAFIQFKKVQQPRGGLAAFGLLSILVSIFVFDEQTPFPSVYALAPVLGTACVLLFGTRTTWTARLLSTRFFVSIGLISYSAYLWHQPLFAFARINSYTPPSLWLMFTLSLCSLVCAWLSWKYVETPFRNKKTIPLRPFIVIISLSLLLLAAFGLTLHFKQGVPGRMFAFDKQGAAAGMHIDFNFQAFKYDQPEFPENEKQNVLVVGDSFARDFINAGVETGHFTNVNLIYREEFKHCQKGFADSIKRYEKLLPAVDIVIISFDSYKLPCLEQTIEFLKKHRKNVQILVIGPKDFGYNLNKYMQLDPEERINARTKILDKVVAHNLALKELLPEDIFVDIIDLLSEGGTAMPVFTRDGFLISQDRKHLTRKGAQALGEKIFQHPLLQQFGD